MDKLQLINEVYEILESEIVDKHYVSEFWQIILTLLGLKKAYLKSTSRISNESLIKISKKYPDFIYKDKILISKNNNETVLKYLNENNNITDQYTIYGIVLGYPSAGDRRKIKTKYNFLWFKLYPNENYNKLVPLKLKLKKPIEIIIIGCTEPNQQIMNECLIITDNFNLLFESLNIGKVIMELETVD